MRHWSLRLVKLGHDGSLILLCRKVREAEDAEGEPLGEKGCQAVSLSLAAGGMPLVS